MKISSVLAGMGLIGALYFSVKCVENTYSWHRWDKDVTTYVQIANGAMRAGSPSSELIKDAPVKEVVSMEASLKKAVQNAESWEGINPAILWKTPYSDVNEFRTLATYAAKQSKAIEDLRTAMNTGKLPSPLEAPWIGQVYEMLSPGSGDTPRMRRLVLSEIGKTVSDAYESLNDVISGGQRFSERTETIDRSLVYILESAAGWRSFIGGEANDYQQAAARVKVAHILANMGAIPDALVKLEQAYKLMDHYPDSKNLSLFRDVATLNQGTLKRSILSAIQTLREVEGANPAMKYSAGWWGQVSKFGESIAGKETPCLTDLADNISDRYALRAWWDVAFIALFGFFTWVCWKVDRY